VEYLGTMARWVLASAVCVAVAGVASTPASAADLVTKAPPADTTPFDVNSTVLWLGSDFKNNVDAGNVGGIYAFSGNLDAPGWLVRGQATYVGYDFSSPFAASGQAHGNFAEGSVALGYQWTGNGFVASAFVGPDYQNYAIQPAAAADPRVGDQWGAIFWGRVATMGGAQFPSAIDGQYTTANNSFWVRGRTGVRVGRFILGPEVISLGNAAFDEFRGGGYISYDLTSKVILQADLGYADATWGENSGGGRGGSGVYGGVTLVLLH
jgi:Cellulose biosynthesis protein BcsS